MPNTLLKRDLPIETRLELERIVAKSPETRTDIEERFLAARIGYTLNQPVEETGVGLVAPVAGGVSTSPAVASSGLTINDASLINPGDTFTLDGATIVAGTDFQIGTNGETAQAIFAAFSALNLPNVDLYGQNASSGNIAVVAKVAGSAGNVVFDSTASPDAVAFDHPLGRLVGGMDVTPPGTNGQMRYTDNYLYIYLDNVGWKSITLGSI